MKPVRSSIFLAALVMLLPLVTLLVTPYTSFCPQIPAAEESALSGQDGCCPASSPADGTPSKNDGCCSLGGCCTACAITLAGDARLPEVNRIAGRILFSEPALFFPEVHLPIFVPPESICLSLAVPV